MRWALVRLDLINLDCMIPVKFVENYKYIEIKEKLKCNVFWSPKSDDTPNKVVQRNEIIPVIEVTSKRKQISRIGWYPATILLIADSKELLLKNLKNEDLNFGQDKSEIELTVNTLNTGNDQVMKTDCNSIDNSNITNSALECFVSDSSFSPLSRKRKHFFSDGHVEQDVYIPRWRITDLIAENFKLKEAIDFPQTSKNTLPQFTENLLTDAVENNELLLENCSDPNKKVLLLLDIIKNLKSKILCLKEKCIHFETKKCSENVVSLKNKIASIESDNKTLVDMYEDSSKQIRLLEHQKYNMHLELENFKEKLLQLHIQNEELANKCSYLSKFEQNYINLQSDLKELKEKNSTLEVKNEKLSEYNFKLLDDLLECRKNGKLDHDKNKTFGSDLSSTTIIDCNTTNYSTLNDNLQIKKNPKVPSLSPMKAESFKETVIKTFPHLSEERIEELMKFLLEVKIDVKTDLAEMDENAEVIMENSIENQNQTDSRKKKNLYLNGSSLNHDWILDYTINWNNMPEDLMEALNHGERPSPALRREMIRIIVRDICRITDIKKIGRRVTRKISEMVISAYPLSFQETLCGEVMNNGFHNLMRQIELRIENQRRPNESYSAKYQTKVTRQKKNAVECTMTLNSPVTSLISDLPSAKKYYSRKFYGCLDLEYSISKHEENTQAQKVSELKSLASNLSDVESILKLYKETFQYQRMLVIKGCKVEEMLQSFPLFFHIRFIIQHCKQLMGFDLREKFFSSSQTKTVIVLKCLKKPTEDTVHEDNSSVDFIYLIRKLAKYFNDEEESILILKQDGNLKDIDLTDRSCIIVSGDPLPNSALIYLYIDGIEVGVFETIEDAFISLFASYFVFNIKFPREVGNTLDFFQRCFFSINPETGSKTFDRKKSKSNFIPPKVSSLLKKLSDMECHFKI